VWRKTKLTRLCQPGDFVLLLQIPAKLMTFVKFITDELVPRNVNTLILRVDWKFQYNSHPELRDSFALSKDDVKKIVAVCKKNSIRLIPQINLLGHQSWAGQVSNLLRVYPQFDETPHVKMPAKYVWPNADGLYCKSYCPLHPDLHKIVFDLVDEICDAFESNAFHAGLDEVFYLGDDKCPRCQGPRQGRIIRGEKLEKSGITLLKKTESYGFGEIVCLMAEQLGMECGRQAIIIPSGQSI
jgi:hypothetical protein